MLRQNFGGLGLSDGDFHLFFFATQPFLKVNYKGKRLCTLDDIVANDDYRVLDTEGNIIGGLYVTGNDSGRNYMGSYPNQGVGTYSGRCAVNGMLTGKALAAM